MDFLYPLGNSPVKQPAKLLKRDDLIIIAPKSCDEHIALWLRNHASKLSHSGGFLFPGLIFHFNNYTKEIGALSKIAL